MSMEQQMQQQMEASEFHQLEDAYDEMNTNHNLMATALADILPQIDETNPDLYVKYMGLIDLVEKIKPKKD